MDVESAEFCVWVYLNDCSPLGDHGLPPRKLVLAAYLWASRSLFHAWREAFTKNAYTGTIPVLWDVDPTLIERYTPLCLEFGEEREGGEGFLFSLPPWRALLDIVGEHYLFFAFREGERRDWAWCAAVLMDAVSTIASERA